MRRTALIFLGLISLSWGAQRSAAQMPAAISENDRLELAAAAVLAPYIHKARLSPVVFDAVSYELAREKAHARTAAVVTSIAASFGVGTVQRSACSPENDRPSLCRLGDANTLLAFRAATITGDTATITLDFWERGVARRNKAPRLSHGTYVATFVLSAGQWKQLGKVRTMVE